MNEKEMSTQETQNLTGKGNNDWVFIPLSKKHLIKRTDTYVLFDVDGVASGIINAKFLRKKETEDMLFFSVPADYEINCQVREKIGNRWEPTSSYKVTAKNAEPIIRKYNHFE